MPRVLVTGSAGRIGLAVVQELAAQGIPVRGFDLVPTPGVDHVVGSITDAAAVKRALAEVETLIHLAATPDDDEFHSRLLPNNLHGVYEILQAARDAGTKRYILASTGQVVDRQRTTGPLPISEDTQPTPRGWYAATKVFLEGAGRMISGADGATVIAVRLGWCPRTPEQAREIASLDWAKRVYLSPADAGRFFVRAAFAPLDGRFHIVYAASRPAGEPIFDDAPARRLGFDPCDTWPEGVEDWLAAR